MAGDVALQGKGPGLLILQGQLGGLQTLLTPGKDHGNEPSLAQLACHGQAQTRGASGDESNPGIPGYVAGSWRCRTLCPGGGFGSFRSVGHGRVLTVDSDREGIITPPQSRAPGQKVNGRIPRTPLFAKQRAGYDYPPLSGVPSVLFPIDFPAQGMKDICPRTSREGTEAGAIP